MAQEVSQDNPYEAPHEPVRDIMAESSGPRLARRLSRLAASVVDSMLFIGIALLAGIFSGIGIDAKLISVVLVLSIAALGIANLYLLARSGQTIGKKALGIKIVRMDGSQAGLVRILFLRSMPPAIIGFIPIIGIVFALADVLLILGEPRRCLHDYFANTVVVEV
jgi:uncharacterized RDD family membrane protein YckC